MYSIETSLGFTLGKISQRMSEIFEKSLEEKGISPKQYGILLVVYGNKELTQKLVADKVAIDRTTMGQHVDILEEKNYISRIRSKHDKRAYNLVLTPEGRDAVTTLWEPMVSSEKDIIQTLSKQQQLEFRKLVRSVYENEKQLLSE